MDAQATELNAERLWGMADARKPASTERRNGMPAGVGEIEDSGAMQGDSTEDGGGAGPGGSRADGDRTESHDGKSVSEQKQGDMAPNMDLALHRLSPSIDNGHVTLGQTPALQSRRDSEARGGARGTVAPNRSQSTLPELPKTLLVIAIALLVSVLEVVLSILNAVQDDAFRLTSFKGYVYSASSIMEVVGLLFGLARYFCLEGGVTQLGLPMVLISAGVVEDDLNSRMIGFHGTVLQATFIFLLLVIWLCLTIDWFFWVVVTVSGCCCCGFPLCLCVCMRRRTMSAAEGILPPPLTSDAIELDTWMYLTLPFSPVVIELLESYFLLRDFSLDRLVLLVVDVLVILPGIAWLVVQVLNRFKPFASSLVEQRVTTTAN